MVGLDGCEKSRSHRDSISEITDSIQAEIPLVVEITNKFSRLHF